MLGGGELGLVEDFDLDMVVAVDQRRKPTSDWPPLRSSSSSGSSPKVQAVYLRGLGRRRRRCGRRAARVSPRPAQAHRCRRRGADLQRRQRLEGRTPAAELGLQRGEVAAGAELAAVLVDDAEVHRQVRAQLLALEVVALHRELVRSRTWRSSTSTRSPCANSASATNSSAYPAAAPGASAAAGAASSPAPAPCRAACRAPATRSAPR